MNRIGKNNKPRNKPVPPTNSVLNTKPVTNLNKMQNNCDLS